LLYFIKKMREKTVNLKQDAAIHAPCKINVHLRIKDRRSDGYHNIESIFLALAFGDVLRFQLTGDEGVCAIQMDWRFFQDSGICAEELEPLPAEKNSIHQAVSLFRDRTGFNRGIQVYVEKRIPLGAGLGGGSSDAASTLSALNVLAGTALAPRVLKELAETLGSDVPFFLYGGAAWVSGRGEQITPIRMPEGLSVVLAYPGFPSNTGKAFRLLDETRFVQGYVSDESRTETLIHTLSEHPGKWTYQNDFLPVFLAEGDKEAVTAYRRILKTLDAAGADFTGLSGSGSACFGIFVDGGMAEKAVQAVDRQRNFVQLTIPLAHFPNRVLE
jgi:4-diphosphocytidyl-2-C-methyl-D-erythritol kinase